MRGNRELAKEVKLVILDEGHLLGATERLVANEIFFEELRYHMVKNGGRFLLLSAVLPNEEELSQWLTGHTDHCFKEKWRPSDERLGILEWNGKGANLNWESLDTERPAFNNGFVTVETTAGVRGRTKTFPTDKNEAVAAAAYKLKTFGTALIFVGLKTSVFVMAGAYLKAMGSTPELHVWKNNWDWKSFELASIECYGSENEWLEFAKYGILCHHGDLHVDVRTPLERLMRNEKPLVIVSTSTLGQGVNLGVSTVIFSTIHQAGKQISKRDFWNIAGRAGRAFVDTEGKILVAWDNSASEAKEINKALRTRRKIRGYFDKVKLDKVRSGILTMAQGIKRITTEKGIDFSLLLQLITENKTEDEEKTQGLDKVLDLMDDGLLALHDLHNEEGENDLGWVETFFRQSLASIQINEESTLTRDEFNEFIRSRVQGIVRRVGSDKSTWKGLITSGIPLRSDLHLENLMTQVIEAVTQYSGSKKGQEEKMALQLALLELIKTTPLLEKNSEQLNSPHFEGIIREWLEGVSMSTIHQRPEGAETIADLCTYKLPWLLSGLAKKLRSRGLEDDAIIVEELSILLETGLPSLTAVKIYQGGIRSRLAAQELASYFEEEFWEKTIKQYKLEILSNKQYYLNRVSLHCGQWIRLLEECSPVRSRRLKRIRPFSFNDAVPKTTILLYRTINGTPYLHSPDFGYIKDISGSPLDFSSYSGVAGIQFKYQNDSGLWEMIVSNPNVEIDEEEE